MRYMAASCTAGLPKLSKAMRGQTLRAWRKVASPARLTARFSAAVCRECPSQSLAGGERRSGKPSDSGPDVQGRSFGVPHHVLPPGAVAPRTFTKVLRLSMIVSTRIDRHHQGVEAVIAKPSRSRYPRAIECACIRSRWIRSARTSSASTGLARWRTDAENFTRVHHCPLVVRGQHRGGG